MNTMEWQPIETAPKDGTEILVFCPYDYPQCVVVKWICGEYDDWSAWSFVDEVLADVAPEGASPTHWMPLPEAPTGGKA